MQQSSKLRRFRYGIGACFPEHLNNQNSCLGDPGKVDNMVDRIVEHGSKEVANQVARVINVSVLAVVSLAPPFCFVFVVFVLHFENLLTCSRVSTFLFHWFKVFRVFPVAHQLFTSCSYFVIFVRRVHCFN